MKPYEEGITVDIHSGVTCPICFDNDQFTYKSWVQLHHCRHRFHRHCIDLWLEQARTCPLCVREVHVDIEAESVSESSVMDCVTHYGLRCACILLALSLSGIFAAISLLYVKK